MHTDDFNKCNKVSLRPSPKLHHLFRQEIWTMKVIKCYPESPPEGDKNSNSYPKPRLKENFTNTNFVTFIKNWPCISFSVFVWRHGGHVGVQNNSEKSLLGLWFYYYAKLKRNFAIVLYTNMATSSRDWKPRISCIFGHKWHSDKLLDTWAKTTTIS